MEGSVTCFVITRSENFYPFLFYGFLNIVHGNVLLTNTCKDPNFLSCFPGHRLVGLGIVMGVSSDSSGL
jgi:hypothetical protein